MMSESEIQAISRVMRGDEFGRDEYSTLLQLQILKTGAATTQKPATETTSGDTIEVFDETQKQEDLYTIPDDEKKRILLRLFDNDHAMANQFVRIITHTARQRALFRIHKGLDIMARQLVLIGQNLKLFAARIVIPVVSSMTTDTFMDKIRRNNYQPMVRGRLIRKPQTPKHNVSGSNGTQFPHNILAVQQETTTAFETHIPPNTVTQIKAIRIAPVNAHPYPAGTIPGNLQTESEFRAPERNILAFDESSAPQDISLSEATPEQFARVFTYLRLLYRQAHSARPPPPSISADFAPPVVDDAPIVIPQDFEQIAHLMQILGLQPDFTYSTTIFQEFANIGREEIFWRARLNTLDIGQIRAQVAANEAARQSMRDYRALMARQATIAAIIAQYYPAARPQVLRLTAAVGQGETSVPTRVEAEDIMLARLKAPEKQFVLAQYERLRQVPPAASSCEHAQRLKRLTSSVARDDIRASLAQLESILTPVAAAAATNGMRTCSICGQAIVCPHTLIMARGTIEGQSLRQERSDLSPFVEQIPAQKMNYCRVCGECFFWTLSVADDPTHEEPTDSDLVAEIFREMATLRKYIRSRRIVDQQSFFKGILRDIYPFIESIKTATELDQTKVAADIHAKMRITIAIYIFADCIANMNQYDITFAGFHPDSRIEARATKYAIDKILAIESAAFTRLPTMTREIVGTNIIAAVRQLHRATQDFTQEIPPMDYRSTLAYDPIFAILLHCQGYSGKQPFDYRDKVYKMLPAVPNGPNIYEALFRACRSPEVDIISRAAQLREFDYPIPTKNHAVQAFRERVEAARAVTRDLEQASAHVDRMPVPHIVITHDSDVHLQRIPRGKLSQVYDEEGRPHRWNKLIFESPTHEIIEVPMRESSSAFARTDIKFIDKKCTTCGILQSQTDKLDIQHVRDAIDLRARIENFYRFYETRCPNFPSHVFSEGNECTKCGFTRAKLEQLDRAYYDKYSSTLIAPAHVSRKETEDRTYRATILDAQPVPYEQIEALARTYCDLPWKSNFEIVVKTATLLKIDRQILQTLFAKEGLTSQQLYDESFVARVPKVRDDVRIQALYSCLVDTISFYEAARASAPGEKISIQTIARFVEDLRRAGVREIAPLGKVLSESGMFATDAPPAQLCPVLLRAATLFGLARKPTEIVNYYLEMLCLVVQAMHAHAPIVAQHIMQHFLATERITMKAEHVSISVLEGTKLASDDFGIGVGTTDREFDEEDEADIPTGKESEEDDPFSLDAFDIEQDSQDPDDSAVVMRIGDEMGW